MAEETKQVFLDLCFQKINPNVEADQDHDWVTIDEAGENVCESTASMEDDSGLSCSTDLVEDASSSNDGPLYELSELMAQLPIKRGLSKFYKGKSQSYTSLASVKGIQDLAKKVNPYSNRSKMKSCKSYAVLDAHKSFSSKATISKKSSRGSFLSSSFGKRSASLVADF